MSEEVVAVVAGAGGAPGRATAAALASEGLTVVALDRSERAMSDLSGSARKVAAVPAVVTGAINRIAAEVGPPGELVNVVGAFRTGDAGDTTPETLRLMLDVNLGPALWLSHGAGERHGGLQRQQGCARVLDAHS